VRAAAQYVPAPVRRTLWPSSSPAALLPVAVGAMNIHDVRDRQTDVVRQTDIRHASFYNAPWAGA